MTDAASDGAFERLWVRTLGRLTEAAAHELRNALNGVAVNLEVVRSRAGRHDVAGDRLVPFAEAATGQLELATARAEALLALARPVRGPADIGKVIRDTLTVLGAKSPVNPTDSDASLPPAGEWAVGSDGAVVRLLLVELVLDGSAGSMRTMIRRTAEGLLLEVAGVKRSPDLTAALDLAARQGIGVAERGDQITLTFADAGTTGA